MTQRVGSLVICQSQTACQHVRLYLTQSPNPRENRPVPCGAAASSGAAVSRTTISATLAYSDEQVAFVVAAPAVRSKSFPWSELNVCWSIRVPFMVGSESKVAPRAVTKSPVLLVDVA